MDPGVEAQRDHSSGGPNSVYGESVPTADPDLLDLGTPVLGLCYGMQLLAHLSGGNVTRADRREYGRASVTIEGGRLFNGFGRGEETPVWMSHGDHVDVAPPGYRVTASSANSPVAAFEHERPAAVRRAVPSRGGPHAARRRDPRQLPVRGLRGHAGLDAGTLRGDRDRPYPRAGRPRSAGDLRPLGRRGLVGRRRAGAPCRRRPADLHLRGSRAAPPARARAGGGAPSGDTWASISGSSTRARAFSSAWPASTDPEEKRRRIGHTFIDVFEAEARSVGSDVGFLVQGTLYPDVIESLSPQGGPSVTIKTHHNVGGLPERLQFALLEPLRELFKDEVRQVGRELGLPEEMVGRHPFPGPGLAIRILGEVTPEALDILRRADHIYHRGDPRGRAVRRDLAGVLGAAADPLGRRAGRLPELRPGHRAPRGHQPRRHDGRLVRVPARDARAESPTASPTRSTASIASSTT